MNRSPTLLLIEEHPIAAELIRNLLAANKPLCRLLEAETFEQGLAHLKRESVQLIIMNLPLPPTAECSTFLTLLDGWNPAIPVIAMTNRPSDDAPVLAGGLALLPKPVDFDALLHLVDTITRTTNESVLNGVSLENFLQIIEQERKTCTLRLISGYQMGMLYIRHGRIIQAQTGPLRHKEAVLAILAWPNCTINISEDCQVEPAMNLSIHLLLVEWCIHKDEKDRNKSLEAA